MKKQLIQVGLEEREAEIYLQLLKKKKQTANEISKQVKINRSVVYSMLEKLIEKGLVSHILINNTKHFSANKPETLADFIKDKERILAALIPNLNSIKEQEKKEFSSQVYEGKKGGIAILKDIIREGKDYVSFGDNGCFQEILGTHADQYARQLEEKKIKERLLVKKGVKLERLSKNTKVRYLSKDFDFPTITTIYGDKVAIAILEEPYHTILIKSQILAYTYKKMFEALWQIAKE